MRLYNTLTRSLEPFSPLAPPAVTMYVCGPTVYDDPHIGHVRSAYIFDVLRRYLTHQGFAVRFIRNVTDVDDKIIEKARQELVHSPQSTVHSDLKAKCREVAERYLASYHGAMDRLGIERPDVEPLATEHVVPEMTDCIAKLLLQGAAYEVKGDVYFSVRKFPDYGKLSNRMLDELQAGSRVEPGEHPGPPSALAGAGKQDPLDFALWKAAKPDEPSWESPWGKGRPGWHIECSTMSTKYLGEEFDIHGGGVDLVFPHHENEIAQARSAGKPFARYWVHNGLLTVQGEKMSKSLGNFITVEQALEDCNQDPDVLKMVFLSVHYRSPLNYMKAITTASKQHYDHYRLLIDLENNRSFRTPGDEEFMVPVVEVEKPKRAFFNALDDDLHTPKALSALDEMRSLGSLLLDEYRQYQLHVHRPVESVEERRLKGKFLSVVKTLREHGKLLGLFENLKKTDLSKQIDELFEQYKTARGSKDFKTSDTLRKKLHEQGFIVQDTGGTSILIHKW